jgi:hypothetical protein
MLIYLLAASLINNPYPESAIRTAGSIQVEHFQCDPWMVSDQKSELEDWFDEVESIEACATRMSCDE